MVLSMFGFPTGDLNPVYNAPMLGAHKAVLDNRLPAPSPNDFSDYNP